MNTHQERNQKYEFTHLELCEADFNSLIFMNPPEGNDKWHNSSLENLCVQPLNSVTAEVLRKSTYQKKDRATGVFAHLDMQAYRHDRKSWFDKHAHLSAFFSKRLMPPIWIRNLGKHDGWQVKRTISQNCDSKCYIDDGNTRALVYAVRVACGEEKFEPVKAIHSTSWDFTEGILGHIPQHANELYYEGRFQNNLSPDTEIKKRFSLNMVLTK